MTNSEFQALLDEAYSHQKLMAKLNAISYEIIELSKVQQKRLFVVDRILHAFQARFWLCTTDDSIFDISRQKM